MTLEEKRSAIEAKCDEYKSCESCPLLAVLSSIDEKCYTETDDPRTDAKVERNYEILFGTIETTTTREKPQYFDQLLRIMGKEAVEHFCLCSALWYLMDGKTEPAQKYMAKYLELVQVQDRVQDA